MPWTISATAACNGAANAENANSRNAARRLGFRFEGIFYRHMIYKGKNRDTAWYSILDEEWPELRAIFEAWLLPENFDARGTAKVSLSAMMERRAGGPVAAGGAPAG